MHSTVITFVGLILVLKPHLAVLTPGTADRITPGGLRGLCRVLGMNEAQIGCVQSLPHALSASLADPVVLFCIDLCAHVCHCSICRKVKKI